MRGATVEVRCPCGRMFTARVADRNRGWGRFCSKSCKAGEQSKRAPKRRSRLPRPDGYTPMLFKDCAVCGAPAVNGVYINGGIEWGCALHHDTTPITAGHGQWE